MGVDPITCNCSPGLVERRTVSVTGIDISGLNLHFLPVEKVPCQPFLCVVCSSLVGVIESSAYLLRKPIR